MKGSIKHDGSSWYYQVTLGTKPNGKRHQVKKRGFSTEKEAERACRKAITEYEDGLYVQPNKITFRKAAEDYMTFKKPYISPVTYNCYESLLKSTIVPFLGDYKLTTVNPPLIYDFYRHMYDNALSGATRAKVHDIICGIMRHATNVEYIKKNPMNTVAKPSRDKRQTKVWNAQQIEKFLATATSSPYFIVYYIALMTGMRQGEILGLRWKDVDFESGKLSIKQTRKNDGSLGAGAKTAKSIRSLILAPAQLDVLKRHQELQKVQKKNLHNVYSDFDLIAASEVGTSISPSNLRRDLNKMIEQANLPKIRFHDLRHSHATFLLSINKNTKLVADRLGHASVKTTLDTYTHFEESQQGEVSQDVANSIKVDY